MYNNHTMICIC